MSPVNEARPVISDPQTVKSAQPVKEQTSKGPPPRGSRFNPIYIKPGSTSIKSTRDLQMLFPNSFDCIGDIYSKYNIKTNLTDLPVQGGRCKVPIEYKDEIEKELWEMVRQWIITKQTIPTPLVSSMTYPKKANDKLRICLDPKDLNKAIIWENHKAPILEEIAHTLTGGTKFFKVDYNKVFFGMHLTKEESLLTTFNTHLGRYRFLRVPFRLTMSLDIFQMWMDDIVAQCPRVLAIHDDIFIYGKDDKWPWCKHHQFVQCSPKRGTCFQQHEMQHKTRFCDILWRCIFSWRLLTRSSKDTRHHRDDTPSDKTGDTVILGSSELPANLCTPSQSSHRVTMTYPEQRKQLHLDENLNTSFQKSKVPTWESTTKTSQVLQQE